MFALFKITYCYCVHTHMQLVYSESRMELPYWMLDTKAVHTKKIPCKSSDVSKLVTYFTRSHVLVCVPPSCKLGKEAGVLLVSHLRSV